MPRRVSLPGASELFRPTRPAEPARPAGREQPADQPVEPRERVEPGNRAEPEQRAAAGRRPRRTAGGGPAEERVAADGTAESSTAGGRSGSRSGGGRTAGAGPVRGTGRVRHDEKITVYVSSEELLALEQARLTLRAQHGMAVDRGRIVREAVAAALADLELHGEDSELVRRLAQ